MGPTITFNLKRADGSWFGYREVEKIASLSGIQLRVRKLTFLIVINQFFRFAFVCFPSVVIVEIIKWNIMTLFLK